jgi:uncharacterized membrane protein (UPF0127 family)
MMPPSRADRVHTVALSYSVDVVFLDRAARIIRVCPAVPAGRVRLRWRAAAVLELAAGQAGGLGLTEGTQLPALRPMVRL